MAKMFPTGPLDDAQHATAQVEKFDVFSGIVSLDENSRGDIVGLFSNMDEVLGSDGALEGCKSEFLGPIENVNRSHKIYENIVA